MSEIKASLEQDPKWGDKILFNSTPIIPWTNNTCLFYFINIQVGKFSVKKSPSVFVPQFQVKPLTISNSTGILRIDIVSDVQFWDHLEGKAKLASKNLDVLNRFKQ